MEQLAGDITKGKQLKHAETHDKSAPAIEADVHVKKVDRKAQLDEIAKPHDLKHAETHDKSAPAIPSGAHVEKSKRPDLLAEIAKKGAK